MSIEHRLCLTRAKKKKYPKKKNGRYENLEMFNFSGSWMLVKLSNVFCLFLCIVVDPNFYSKNFLMIGKTYLKQGNTKMALLYLTKARDAPARKEEEYQVRHNDCQ